MELEIFIRCLHSETRRKILQLLSKEDMSAPQIYRKLGENAPKYRQSVNKALEILTECGLVRKYYANEKKAIFYGLTKKKYTLKIPEMEVE